MPSLRSPCEIGFALTTIETAWRWAADLMDQPGRPRLLSRRQFERRTQRHLANGWGRSGALLFVEVDSLVEAHRILGRRGCDLIVHRFSQVIVSIASDCPATLVTPDAVLVYAHSTPHVISMAEAIRVAVQQELGLDQRALHHPGQWQRPSSEIGGHALTVTIGACAIAHRQDFHEALQGAEDALLLAKQAGGNRFFLNPAFSTGM